MDFDPPESVRPLLERIEKFVADVVMPAEPRCSSAASAGARRCSPSCARECKAAGLWGPQLPKELGGLGLGARRARPGLRAARPLAARPLRVQLPGARRRQHGDPPQVRHAPSRRRRWLEPLARGEIRSCFSMTEPENPGSNPTLLSCTRARATATTT